MNALTAIVRALVNRGADAEAAAVAAAGARRMGALLAAHNEDVARRRAEAQPALQRAIEQNKAMRDSIAARMTAANTARRRERPDADEQRDHERPARVYWPDGRGNLNPLYGEQA
jgi:hypothetical protein